MRAMTLAFGIVGLLATACAVETTESASSEDQAVAGRADHYEYETKGGFTAFNFKLTLDCVPNSTGKAHVTKSLHTTPSTFEFDGTVTKAQCTALRNAVPSNFASLPAKLYFKNGIADVPDVRVNYAYHDVTKLGRAGTPVAPQSFDTFAQKLGDVFQSVSEQEYAHYASSGGFAYRNSQLTIKNSGEVHYTNAGLGGAKDVTGYVDAASLVALGALFETKSGGAYAWYALPAKFPGPVVADGIGYSVRWDGPNGAKEVASATSAHETALYTHVRDALDAIATTVASSAQ